MATQKGVDLNGSSPLARGTLTSSRSALLHPRFIPAGAGNTKQKDSCFGVRSVHPRWRGEHSRVSCGSVMAIGSSPLARGTRCGRPCATFCPPVHPRWRGEHGAHRCTGSVMVRFIPAGAGNTSWAMAPSAQSSGSSPLARGTLFRPQKRCCLCRFIPAGAGNTPYTNKKKSKLPVHPRWRGEHFRHRPRGHHQGGSSPLARGTLPLGNQFVNRVRFIPAGAGNTPSPVSIRPTPTVHPRWRGEHRKSRVRADARVGSSPLARGTHRVSQALQLSRRFIPAGAGNTAHDAPQQSAGAVHPRWRGEHDVEEFKAAQGHRFIPAGAGNTQMSQSQHHACAVHPRWRGEHHRLNFRSCKQYGSSPLARGTPTVPPPSKKPSRFIPAGAGNTA